VNSFIAFLFSFYLHIMAEKSQPIRRFKSTSFHPSFYLTLYNSKSSDGCSHLVISYNACFAPTPKNVVVSRRVIFDIYILPQCLHRYDRSCTVQGADEHCSARFMSNTMPPAFRFMERIAFALRSSALCYALTGRILIRKQCKDKMRLCKC
jgi:hypothetical protein